MKPRDPDALTRLLDAWAERDDRYTNARLRLSPEQESMVIRSRREEALRLAPDDRMEALLHLAKWTPPAGRWTMSDEEPVSPQSRTGWGLRLVTAR